MKCLFCDGTGQTEDNKKPRSIRQNKAYFGLAVQRLADHYQVEKEIMHKGLAGAYFGFEEIKIGELIIKAPKSTKGRSTVEFMEYFAWIQKLAAEERIDISSPNEPPPREE
jgi:hypothetical protein